MLQIAEKRREAKGKGERERYTQMNADFQRMARKEKLAFLNEQYKELEEINRMGKTRDLFRKLDMPREYFMQRWDNNGQKLLFFFFFLFFIFYLFIFLILFYF